MAISNLLNDDNHNNREKGPKLDPNELELDEDTRKRKQALAQMDNMTIEELSQLAVRAGIYNEDGSLAEYYCDSDCDEKD